MRFMRLWPGVWLHGVSVDRFRGVPSALVRI